MSELNMQREYKKELRALARQEKDMRRGFALVTRRMSRELRSHERALKRGLARIDKRRAILEGRLS